jgi:tRNA A37 threonylcarbamoyladenosine dehydratase
MLLAAAGAGAALGVAATLWLRPGEPERPPADAAAHRTRLARQAKQADLDAVTLEQFSRNRLYFGEAGQARLQGAFVVVVGLGGVGSHAAHMLARAGVGRLRLIDFDNLTLSSLNRHAVGTRDDVGRPKVDVCRDHFHDVVPTCRIEALAEMFTAEAAEALLAGHPDYVIDAIDDINTKTDLVLACNTRGLRTISALGAGAKADPTRVVIGDMTDPVNDPLAAKLRSFVRNRLCSKSLAETESKRPRPVPLTLRRRPRLRHS